MRAAERDQVVIQSKVGIREGYFDFSREHILTSVDESLAALRTDYLDILLLHRPDTLVEPEEVASAFDELHAAGKVRAFGVSNHTPGQIELLKKSVSQPLVVNQVQLSITHAPLIAQGVAANMAGLDQSISRDNGILDYSRLHDITLQAWSPFQRGFFDGVFLGDRENYADLNDRIDELAEKYDVTPTGIAVAWITRHPANMQVVLGTTNPQRVQELLWSNPRVTFFREEPLSDFDAAFGPRGAQGVPLTPGRSIAVDKDSMPYGTPLWLASPGPLVNLQRLVFAQDTGSAITGAVRADFFVGSGDEAGDVAGRLKQPLNLWVLWPR